MSQRIYTKRLEMKALLIKGLNFNVDEIAKLNSTAHQKLTETISFAYIRKIKKTGGALPIEGTTVDFNCHNAKSNKKHGDWKEVE